MKITETTSPTPPHDPAQDPFQTILLLESALEDPELLIAEQNHGEFKSLEQRQAALRLAAALGRTRLWGVDCGSMDGDLPQAAALAAAQRLSPLADELRDAAEKLEERWAATDEELEGTDMAVDLLEGALDLWAAHIAIHDAIATRWLGDGVGLEHLAPVRLAIDAYLLKWEDLDQALHQCADTLSVVCDTHLLSNWRSALVEPWRELAPWWLSGGLEALAERNFQRLLETMPAPARRHPSAASLRISDFLGQPVPLGAAASPQTPATPPALKRWRGPGAEIAELYSYPQWAEDHEVWLVLTDAAGAKLSDHAGTSVWIGQAASQIDSTGRARFTKGQLRDQADEKFTLRVGTEQRVWEDYE